jgi:hypothetical protein
LTPQQRLDNPITTANRAAVMTILILTGKLNDVDPLAWLANVLARIADIPRGRLLIDKGQSRPTAPTDALAAVLRIAESCRAFKLPVQRSLLVAPVEQTQRQGR